MRDFQERTVRVGAPLLIAGLALIALALGVAGPRAMRADNGAETAAGEDVSRQVTVFAVRAAPSQAGKTKTNGRLASIADQLRRVLPNHDFRLIDAESGRIGTGEAVASDLGQGYLARTALVRSLDENGKVQLRCELFLNGALQFSANVKAPLNQLFFYQRPFLDDGSKLLIGVGVR